MKHLYNNKPNFGQNLMEHRIIDISIHTKARTEYWIVRNSTAPLQDTFEH